MVFEDGQRTMDIELVYTFYSERCSQSIEVTTDIEKIYKMYLETSKLNIIGMSQHAIGISMFYICIVTLEGTQYEFTYIYTFIYKYLCI